MYLLTVDEDQVFGVKLLAKGVGEALDGCSSSQPTKDKVV